MGFIGFPCRGKILTRYSLTQEYHPPHINKDRKCTLSEELAQRTGSRIVLRSAIVTVCVSAASLKRASMQTSAQDNSARTRTLTVLHE